LFRGTSGGEEGGGSLYAKTDRPRRKLNLGLVSAVLFCLAWWAIFVVVLRVLVFD
jgi:hypothetical protein